MASTQGIRAGRAFVELFADDSKLVRGLRRAEKRLRAFGAKVRNLGLKLTGLGTALAAPLGIATRVFAGFDDQMRAVQAVLGATGEQFERLTAKAQHLGRTTSYTAAQVAGAMLELARAGFDTGQIDAAIGSVLALARASGTDLAEASNIAGNALRAFGLEADQMGRTADVLSATANNSAQTLTDLGEAMKYAAPVADAFAKTWERIKASAQKAWNWIKSLLDDSVNLSAENRYVESRKRAAISQIEDDQKRKLAQRESRRQADRKRDAAGQKPEDDAPDRMKGPEELVAKANEMLGKLNVGDMLNQTAKIGATGTFNAANVLGLQAGGVMDRMTIGIEKIERNTRPMRDAEGLAFE